MRAPESGGPFRIRVRVYFEDTDAGGIVYYVNYLKFMERARTECLRSLGFSQALLAEAGALFVVRDAQARYHSPARLDDELEVTAQIAELNRASLVFRQQIRRLPEGTLLCEGQFSVACVRATDMRPQAIPAAVRAAFAAVECISGD